jgi:transcriptional regulator with XRE-family HTH domain
MTCGKRLLAQVCAHRLAEMRQRRGLTQRQVAQAMGVTVGRISQIENGNLAGIDVLDRYVSALGGLADRRTLRGRADQVG